MIEVAWEGVRDGSIPPPPCAQMDIKTFIMSPKSSYKGEEDCLYLNIYTSMVRSTLKILDLLSFSS